MRVLHGCRQALILAKKRRIYCHISTERWKNKSGLRLAPLPVLQTIANFRMGSACLSLPINSLYVSRSDTPQGQAVRHRWPDLSRFAAIIESEILQVAEQVKWLTKTQASSDGRLNKHQKFHLSFMTP